MALFLLIIVNPKEFTFPAVLPSLSIQPTGACPNLLQSILTSVWGGIALASALFSFSIAAAPVLIDENSGIELSKEAWFYAVPVNVEDDSYGDPSAEDLEFVPHKPVRSSTLQRPTANQSVRSSQHGLSTEFGSGFEQNEQSALRDLLRSYLNKHQGNGEVAGQSGATRVTRPSAESGLTAGWDLPVVGHSTIDELLTKAAGLIIRPEVNEHGVMAFSILGLGEFAFMGGSGGVNLSIGEFLSFSVLNVGIDALLPSVFPGGAMGGEAAGPISAGNAAYDGVKDGAESEGNNGGGSAKSAEGQPTKSRFPRMLVFVYDVITYPGTILILVALGFLQLAKAGQKFKGRRVVNRRRGWDRRSPVTTQPVK